MDPLLQGIEENCVGLDVYVGAFAHVDAIHTNMSTLKQQVSYMQQFARENAVVLNLWKCEVLLYLHPSLTCHLLFVPRMSSTLSLQKSQLCA